MNLLRQDLAQSGRPDHSCYECDCFSFYRASCVTSQHFWSFWRIFSVTQAKEPTVLSLTHAMFIAFKRVIVTKRYSMKIRQMSETDWLRQLGLNFPTLQWFKHTLPEPAVNTSLAICCLFLKYSNLLKDLSRNNLNCATLLQKWHIFFLRNPNCINKDHALFSQIRSAVSVGVLLPVSNVSMVFSPRPCQHWHHGLELEPGCLLPNPNGYIQMTHSGWMAWVQVVVAPGI